MSGREPSPLLDVTGAPDVRDTVWYRFVDHIRDLRECPDYAWADTQLAGIAATVEKSERVTERQRRAVAAIRASERTPSRAYDAAGYGRRWR